MKILHLADVHWRNLSRHREYGESFEDLYEKAEDLNPDAIVIVGDIVHDKTRISPELVSELGHFFKKLSDISKVYIINGNHDVNLANKTRKSVLDSVTGIMDNPGIHYLWRTDCYNGDKDVDFYVFSCLDDPSVWEQKLKIRNKNKINIALFHGTVKGAVTDRDFALGSEVGLDLFKDFDYVLLGDIHKRQFLSPKIAYCGSTIQQDFGEEQEKGFLFWDIKSKDDFKCEFYPVLNRFPFVNLNWKNNSKETIELINKYQEGSRFRILSEEDLTFVDKNQIESACKSKEICFENKKTNSYKALNEQKVIKNNNLRDFKTLTNLIYEHFGNDYVSEEQKEDFENLIKTSLTNVEQEDIVRNTSWELKKFEFDNTFRFGMGNVIDFDKNKGILGILGPNRIGKSSIIGSLIYTLFNSTDRGSIKNQHIVNSKKDFCYGKLVLNYAGSDFCIERKTINKKLKNGSVNSNTSLNFYSLENENEDKTDIKRQETDKEIRNKIGLLDDFLLMSIASSKDINSFIRKKSTSRKEIFCRLLDIDVLDQIYDFVKEKSKDIQRDIKKMSEKEWSGLISNLDKEKQTKKQENKKLEESLIKIRKNLFELKGNLEQIKEKCSNLVSSKQILDKQNELTNFKFKLMNFEKEIKTNTDLIKDLEEKKVSSISNLENLNRIKEGFSLEDNKNKIDNLKKELEDKKKSLDLVSSMEKTMMSLESSLRQESNTLDNKEKSVLKLKTVPCGDEYPTCKFIKDSHEDKKQLNSIRDKVETFKQQIKEEKSKLEEFGVDQIKEEIKELEEKIEKYRNKESKFTVLLGKISSFESEISKSDQAISKLNATNSELQINKIKCETLLKEEAIKFEHMKSNFDENNFDKEIKELSSQISVKEIEEKTIDDNRNKNISRIGQIDFEIRSLEQEQEKYEILRKEWQLYEKLIFVFSKKGLPSSLIKARLPEVNQEINRILSNITDFKVVMEIDEESNSNDLDIYIEDGGFRYPIELNSGMEGTVSSIAIRVALMNLSTLPKPSMMFIDEAFDSLDDKNLEICAKMYNNLAKWFKNVIIISHNEKVKNIIENVIEIEKIGEYSHVEI